MRTLRYNLEGEILEVEIRDRSGGPLLDLTVRKETEAGWEEILSLEGAQVVRRGSLVQVVCPGRNLEGAVSLPPSGEGLVCLEGTVYALKDADLAQELEEEEGAGPEVQAPMPGRVVKVLVEAGTKVEKGAPLLVVESMKMETEITAGIGGVVEEVRVAPGDNVNPGDTLVRIQPPG